MREAFGAKGFKMFAEGLTNIYTAVRGVRNTFISAEHVSRYLERWIDKYFDTKILFS